MPPTDLPPPGRTSDADWFHELMVQVAACRRAGDTAGVSRLRTYALNEGGPALAQLFDRTIAAADATEKAQHDGTPGPVLNIGVNLPGKLLCDFCTAPTVVAYYPFDEFTLEGQGVFRSGDRWYVCAHCHGLVEAGDWAGIRNWVGKAASPAVRLLWLGFKMNRTGPAVLFEPGTDPEADRGQRGGQTGG